MGKAIITLGKKATDACRQKALTISEKYGLPFFERGKQSIEQLCQEYGCEQVLVIKKGGIRIHGAQGEFFFHPNMAQLRIKNLAAGGKDKMVEAMGLKAGMKVLDCTLGFAADALVSAYVSGCRVIGLEKQLLPFLAVSDGLKTYLGAELLQKPLKNVQPFWADYRQYLKGQASKSYDIVYFDPMFNHPLSSSASMQPLRALASFDKLDEIAIAEACRVAKYRVVVKENSRSKLFFKPFFTNYVGGKYSHVGYGVIELSGAKNA